MKFVPVRDLPNRPGAVWKKLAEGDLVLTSNGQPIALMTRTSAETLEREIEALERTKALMALDRIQCAAVKSGRDRITDAEIEAEIQAVRRARRRKEGIPVYRGRATGDLTNAVAADRARRLRKLSKGLTK